MAREWNMAPWQVETEIEQDATRDLWIERWRLFTRAEAERMAPPNTRKKMVAERRIR